MESRKFKITYYKPEKQGVFSTDGGYCFATELKDGGESGIIFYKKNKEEFRIPFLPEERRGTLYGIKIEGDDLSSYGYRYYTKDETALDLYTPKVSGLEKWGNWDKDRNGIYGNPALEPFDWENDIPLGIPYEESIIYGLNVRGFTMHKSSGVKNKGTFEGITEKLSHLKKLGITAVELMPAYEYDECMYPLEGNRQTMEEAVKNCGSKQEEPKRLNCWGFQQAYYFAPKSSYSAGEHPETSFKNMVKTLHKNGIEVLMQFYFPPEIPQSCILEVLKFWVIEYHVDGFRLSGFHIPFRMLAQEPVLKETKLRSGYFPLDEIYGKEIPDFRCFAFDNGNFKNDIKKYLKGDEGLLNQVLAAHRHNPAAHGVINYLGDYDGFTLYDNVSYDRKHNEKNGEENRDGTDLNYSWNCGIEGESRKKAIVQLRLKQIKNALSFIFLSQGTPYLFSGDEMANTRYGNNNVYCQDNEIGWVKWKTTQFSEEILDFTSFLVQTRKKHPVLHMKKECRIMDYLSCGYPDISYHGTEPWRPDTSYISRMVGIMLCGNYVQGKKDDSLYIAFNMHWEPHTLALPNLPKGMKWLKIMDTSAALITDAIEDILDENKILTKGRSIALYRAVKDESSGKLPLQKKSKKKAVNKE